MKEVHILVLDDDVRIHNLVGDIVKTLNVSSLHCFTSSKDASSYIKNCSNTNIFAIVDLFLLGNRGQELSGKFIDECLVPHNISYGRLTSAPELVPEHHTGEWVVDKRRLYESDDELLTPLAMSLFKFM